jgi:serine protease Do
MNKFSKTNLFAVVAISLWIGTFLSPILTCGDTGKSSLYLNADPNTKDSPAQAQAIALGKCFSRGI